LLIACLVGVDSARASEPPPLDPAMSHPWPTTTPLLPAPTQTVPPPVILPVALSSLTTQDEPELLWCAAPSVACEPAPEMSLALLADDAPTLEPESDPLAKLPTAPDPARLASPSEMSTDEAIKAIIGLLVLFALAYIAGHPRVQRFERRLGVAQLVLAGFPFILLGLLGRSQGVLSDPVLDAIRPLLPLGLGWIGFAIGFRFDVRLFDNFPRVMLEAFVLTTLLPFAMIVGAAALMLGLVEGMTADAAFVRDALVLATAGAMTARTVVSLLAKRNASPVNIENVQRLIQLEELAAFVGLILLGAFFRPTVGAGWLLPSVGWVFVTVGVGATLGVLIFAALRSLKGANETAAVMLGSICLAAGIAGFLRLSPIVVCFLAGALLVNLPGQWKEQVRGALLRLERPVYLLFLVLAGAIWRADQWEAWVLMAFFVAARLGGRFLGVRIFRRRHPEALGPVEQRHLAASPMGALSVAIVISAQVLYSGSTVPWIVHAIIMGAIATELVVHLFTLKPRLMTGFFPAFTVADPVTVQATDSPTPPVSPPDPAPEERT